MNQYEKLIDGLGGIEEARALSYSESAKLYSAHLNPFLVLISRFLGFNKKFSRASGCYLYDEEGNRYLDFLAGFGSLNLGHEPEELIDALRQTEHLPNFLQSYLNPFAGKLAQHLSRLTENKLSRVFFCNSGAEACEAAMKLTRASTGKKVIVSAEGAYHGKTMGALSISGREKYKLPFAPLVPETVCIPYNDLQALEEILKTQSVAAFIVEPVQGEAGVIVPDSGYLKEVRKLCDQYDSLLILDEVQSGMGRTGRFFCYEYEGIMPDILTLSKSLGGGVIPLAAMLTKDKIWKRAYGKFETALLHSTTFGNNTRACACGIAAIRTIIKKDLSKNAADIGELMLLRLRELQQKYSVLKAVRGKGLMIGLTIARIKGKKSIFEGGLTLWIARQLFVKYRIITAFTLNNYDVLRIAPPLILNFDDAYYFLNSLEDVLKSAEKFAWFRLVK
ncbi:MAG: hypothetical protein A3G33_02295 [Omnitrophica bacterium RIFCSPLOWO2_12_FULL_44_17]|uniref:Putrescine aminotransferase n=1 Tax=Candidatus Danuiimicrobium aquiferis TaxID=1801832 RepID=A0A1G1L141_9BACT|nr:MAG: hypothetical protein A3B72_01875 [Omnitrophica bacterium RIFCSPHIGHO2_02_FULL_45_28]OGW90338.1 MAG: hypothetical protein A3E74_01345 [Omnitrophica bacterium RIFCSPHIGHO2_12_FULL_44_12]OGW98870.1 MAG: hypothetical protein A3G33_02295 [Omnitrophica bacterium RIFCSPLOWO2_12_FULL_44_17]OGX01999.1 MAG: hypothetical protein A3J12_11280 [Omnitrophica bacterium RIFCSPLOWO2_02_FULL_44_11]